MDVAQIISKFGEPSPGWWVIAILAVLSIIQISPIKINPWDAILGWLGRKLNGKELTNLQGEVGERELRAGIEHSTDEWSNVLSQIDEYEVYCEKNHIANGVVKQDSIFINNMYQQLSVEQFNLPVHSADVQ